MDYSHIYEELKATFPQITAELDHPLTPYTTLKIGGPADIFIHTKTQDEFEKILLKISEFVQAGHCPAPTILGNGSNVLISDHGIRGIIIKNSSNSIKILESRIQNPESGFTKTYTQRNENEPEKYLDFTKLDYDESACPQVLVEVTSGTPLPLTINHLIDNGVTGLQWFAYIPGTVGGATTYNIHGGSYHIADYIDSVKVFDLNSSTIYDLPSKSLNWGYEKSHFQQHPELVILSTTLRLFRGDADMAKKVKDAWIAQKVKVQPMNSAGSTFGNPTLEDSKRVWGEQKSTGWIIDHELNWKGKAVGNAQISEKHANFIINNGGATASDVYQLIKEVQAEVQKRFDLHLIPEIKLLGEF